MPRYRMTPPARARGPASESRSGASLAARERRQRRAEQTLTFAQRAFAGSGVAGSGVVNLEDLEAKTRGLRRGCGGGPQGLIESQSTL